MHPIFETFGHDVIVEETYLKKDDWPVGPWQDEPDTIRWMDEDLYCLIQRNPETGTFCGYVIVPTGHPCHGLDADDVADKVMAHRPHGGINYAEPFEETEHWQVGFDCGHLFDYWPGPSPHRPYGTYRDIEYVKEDVETLCQALKSMTA